MPSNVRSRDDRSDRERREREARSVNERQTGGSRTPTRPSESSRGTTDTRAITSRNGASIDTRTGRTTTDARDTRTLTDARDTRMTTDLRDTRAALDGREIRDIRESRSNQEPRTATRDIRDNRDAPFARDPRSADAIRDPRSADAMRDTNTRTAPPVATRERTRDEEPRDGPRTNEYFLPGDGINRDVVTADICKYLGPDTLIKPYKHKDGRNGYLITAYRALTKEMIRTLKEDSEKFESKNRRRREKGQREEKYGGIEAYDVPVARGGDYDDDRRGPITGARDGRYSDEPDTRRARRPSPGFDDAMDIDDPRDTRDTRDARYSGREARDVRDAYDPRDSRDRGMRDAYDVRDNRDVRGGREAYDPRARDPVPVTYGQPAADRYAFDDRAGGDPRRYPSQPVMSPEPYPIGDGRGRIYPDERTAGVPVANRYEPVRGDVRGDPYGRGQAYPPADAIPRGRGDFIYVDQRTGLPIAPPQPRAAILGGRGYDQEMDYEPTGRRGYNPDFDGSATFRR